VALCLGSGALAPWPKWVVKTYAPGAQAICRRAELIRQLHYCFFRVQVFRPFREVKALFCLLPIFLRCRHWSLPSLCTPFE
jgi:hypothetical protein